MSSSRLLSPIYILSISLLLQLALAANPLHHFCSPSENLTSNGLYVTNLKKLVANLNFSTPRVGFSYGSVGRTKNQVYGLAQCRGDVNMTDCQACVDEAGSEIQQSCPNSKAAIIYYDYCQLKYSNLNFSGKIDTQDWFYISSSQNASDPINFNKTLTALFENVTEEAYNVSQKMYASGQMEMGKSDTLYGLVQCTRDLSIPDCKICIDTVTNWLIRILYGKVGGRLVGGSCFARYEIYRFFNA